MTMNKISSVIRFIFFFVLLSCGQSGKGERSQPLSPQEFADQLKSDPAIVLIDVRTADEMQNGFIAGAVNMDFNSPEFEKSIESLDHEKKYLVYCAVGKRSGKALQMMMEKGFTHTAVLDGGTNAWAAAGFPLSRP